MSAPHSSSFMSINDLIDREKCSLSYVRIDDAIQTLQNLGRGSWMCKADITDAFKLIPVKPSQWCLQGVKHLNQYFFFTRLVFGCRSSPKLFNDLASIICWIAKKNYGISHFCNLLDDYLAIDSPDADADRTMALITLIFAKLNIPLSPHKTVGPTHVLEYLGIVLDSNKMEARLPKEKIDRIIGIIRQSLHQKKCTKRELLSLLGHLNFASRIIMQGRTFVSYLLLLAKSVKELYHYVYLDAECRLELEMWHSFLLDWNGISFFLMNKHTFAADFELYTDASSMHGFGAYFQGKWFAGKWPEGISIHDTESSMAFLELYPIVAAAVLWSHNWTSQKIIFNCNNQATVAIINKGRSKSPLIMRLMRRLTLCAMTYCYVVTARYLPGVKNGIADSLSRFQWDRFHQLAPEANRVPETCPSLHEILY